MKDIQTIYQQTIKYAARKHAEQAQTIPGTNIPYVVHLSNVTMEIFVAATNSADFNLPFATQVALLHDVLEDTDTTIAELSAEFGEEVAQAVLSLTKNNDLPKNEKMIDSLERVKHLQKEVWSVKLADRITNLQEPPKHWDTNKKSEYHKEATIILETLQGANSYLENRLKEKIIAYKNYVDHL